MAAVSRLFVLEAVVVTSQQDARELSPPAHTDL
jgi:hypothetical protein